MSSTQENDQTKVETTPHDKPVQTTEKKSQTVLLMFAIAGLAIAGFLIWRNIYPTDTGRGDFDLSNAIVSREEIRHGAMQDIIPALTKPKYLAASDVKFLKPESEVIGILFEGEARAYPLSILDNHEIVNDSIGDVSYAVVYCPLCDSSVVFDRKTSDGEMEFGVSGKLYNSNVLLYDRKSKQNAENSLWSQLMTQSVAGPRVKEQLSTLPMEVTTWKDWQQRFPKTKVLSNNTGYPNSYDRSTYGGYFTGNDLMFPVNKEDKRLPKKTPLLGVWVGDKMRAYPISAFQKVTEPLELEQELAGKKFTLIYTPQSKSLRIAKKDSNIRRMYSFWFAWYAFYPETELFDATMLQPTLSK